MDGIVECPCNSVYPFINPDPHFAKQSHKDKVVLITGGSTGIGYTTALFYAKAGAKLFIVARRANKLEQAKKDIEKEVKGAQVIVLSGDISDPEVGKRAVKNAVDAWGKIDIVIANQFTLVAGPTSRACHYL